MTREHVGVTATPAPRDASTTHDRLCIALDGDSVPPFLELDLDAAKVMMLTIARWLMTFDHLPSPICIDWKNEERPQ